jgi:hypothetical protein
LVASDRLSLVLVLRASIFRAVDFNRQSQWKKLFHEKTYDPGNTAGSYELDPD